MAIFCLHSQVESDNPVNDANPHIVNIGRMVEVCDLLPSPVISHLRSFVFLLESYLADGCMFAVMHNQCHLTTSQQALCIKV